VNSTAPSRTRWRPTLIVDARALRASGIGRYLRECLIELFSDERFEELVLLGDPEQIGGFLSDYAPVPKVRVLKLRGGFYSPLMQMDWVRLRIAGELNGDVAFFPHFDAPVFHPHPVSVVTVQDLIHFKLPALFPLWRRAVAGQVLDRVVGRATRVIVSSESTRRDLNERCSPPTVDVVPFGVGEFFLQADDDRSQQQPVTSRPYLLFVGNRKPHKNVAVVVEALALLRRMYPDLALVVAGTSYRGGDAVRSRASELDLSDALIEVEAPSDATLRALYRGCEVFILPSLYEGFGLPILEAMACGAPVVASNRASMPEVVGDAGLVFDPLKATDLAQAAQRILSDPELRSSLVIKGRHRASEFTWQRAARQVADILYEVATAEHAINASDAGVPSPMTDR
jgi:glycosyltransferase involved in cell wall biosynthesis